MREAAAAEKAGASCSNTHPVKCLETPDTQRMCAFSSEISICPSGASGLNLMDEAVCFI